MRTPSRAGRVAIMALALAAGCAVAGPNLSPSVIGCYTVESDDYSTVHAAITGFRALPEIVALDTAHMGRLLVPQAWRLADPRNPAQAGLTVHSYPWRVVGDYVMLDNTSPQHELGADSVTLRLHGWGGMMTIHLARDGNGYSGLAGFTPISGLPARIGLPVRPEDAPPVRVRLRPATCTRELADARLRGQ